MDVSELDLSVTRQPVAVLSLATPTGFAGQRFADKDQFASPLDLGRCCARGGPRHRSRSSGRRSGSGRAAATARTAKPASSVPAPHGAARCCRWLGARDRARQASPAASLVPNPSARANSRPLAPPRHHGLGHGATARASAPSSPPRRHGDTARATVAGLAADPVLSAPAVISSPPAKTRAINCVVRPSDRSLSTPSQALPPIVQTRHLPPGQLCYQSTGSYTGPPSPRLRSLAGRGRDAWRIGDAPPDRCTRACAPSGARR